MRSCIRKIQRVSWFELAAKFSGLKSFSMANVSGRKVTLALMTALSLFAVRGSYGQDAGQTIEPTRASQAKTEKDTAKTAPQTMEILSSYEGQNVTSVELAGRPDEDPKKFAGLFKLKAGDSFAKDKVEATTAALKATGQFREIQIQVEPEANGVRVLLIPDSSVYFGIFSFPGAEQFPYSKLVQIANFPPEAPYNATDIESDRQALITFFRQEGYFLCEVTPHTDVQRDHMLANVTFQVKLNHRARFGNIIIANATPEEVTKLTKSLQTVLARARGAAIRPGKSFNRSSVMKANQYLQNQLEKRGRLAAQVKLSGAEYHADTNRADIHFDVNAGPTIRVQIEGAHLHSWTRKSLLPFYQGIGVDDESVQEGRQALASYFQAKGFFDVKVDAQVKRENAVDNRPPIEMDTDQTSEQKQQQVKRGAGQTQSAKAS